MKDRDEKNDTGQGPEGLDNPGRTPKQAEGDEETVREMLEREQRAERKSGREMDH